MHPEFEVWKLGESVGHRALDACAIAPEGAREAVPATPNEATWPWILLLGAVHGDEVEGVWLLDELRSRWTKSHHGRNVGVVVWAQVNPDGVAQGQRWNGANVDLNRNLPTKDWTPEDQEPALSAGPSPASEPENKALVRLIDTIKPRAILSAHSFSNFQVNVNGPSREWGERLAEVCGYPVTEDIGYPTPGSLGTYAGKERQIPTITLEIERGLPARRSSLFTCPCSRQRSSIGIRRNHLEVHPTESQAREAPGFFRGAARAVK